MHATFMCFFLSFSSVCDGAVCNATGKSIDRIMMHFLQELVGTSTLQMPLYYCKLGIVELEAGFIVSSVNTLSFS